MPVLTDMRIGLLRHTTSAFIAEDPVSIALQRKVLMPKPGGGHDKPTITLDAQLFRLVNQTASDGLSYSGNDGGEVHSFTYEMVGAWDADVEVDDSWSEGNAQYRVDGLVPNNGYETRAFVTVFAKEPLHG